MSPNSGSRPRSRQGHAAGPPSAALVFCLPQPILAEALASNPRAPRPARCLHSGVMGGTLCLTKHFCVVSCMVFFRGFRVVQKLGRHTSMLVVHCASAGDSLSEQLGALRCAVCIARALGAELVLPRWKCGPFWLSSKHVIDVAPLAALVPLVSEHEAQARCTARTASLSTALAPPPMSHNRPPVPPGAASLRLTRFIVCAWEPAVRLRPQRASGPTWRP